MSSTILVHKSALDALVTHVEVAAHAAIARRGTFSIALPGGSVATEGFPRLAAAAIDWSCVEFFWGDERAVAPTHADSNFGVAERLLLQAVAAVPSRVHRMPADTNDLAEAARAHEEVVRAIGIDLALLGVGPDGHVCSLFPGHPLLAETERWVLPIEDSPKPPPRRLTLTLPALLTAGSVLVVALGASKADVVAEAVEDTSSQLPLALLLRRTDATLLLDEAAASRLGIGVRT